MPWYQGNGITGYLCNYMRIITFVTQKGGAGKTTLAINCAVAAVQRKKSVLIIDLDAQASAEAGTRTEKLNPLGWSALSRGTSRKPSRRPEMSGSITC